MYDLTTELATCPPAPRLAAGGGMKQWLNPPRQDIGNAVLNSYGWSVKEDLLSNVLDLNLELAEREAGGGTVVGPRDPSKEAPAKS